MYPFTSPASWIGEVFYPFTVAASIQNVGEFPDFHHNSPGNIAIIFKKKSRAELLPKFPILQNYPKCGGYSTYLVASHKA